MFPGVWNDIKVTTIANKTPGCYEEIRGCGVATQMSTINFLLEGHEHYDTVGIFLHDTFTFKDRFHAPTIPPEFIKGCQINHQLYVMQKH